VQSEGHVCSGSDGHAAVDYKAVGTLERFESCSSSSDDGVTAIAVVLEHTQVNLSLIVNSDSKCSVANRQR
jgi:hypothetical protein